MASAHDHPDKPDLGADGPAAVARESRMVTIGGRKRGSASPGERIEVKRLRNECRIDGLNLSGQLADRLWAAGEKYRRLWRGAVSIPRTTGSYANQPIGGAPLEPSEYRLHCRQRIAETEEQLDDGQRLAVQAVAGCDESCARRLTKLQAGLKVLADFWDIPESFYRKW